MAKRKPRRRRGRFFVGKVSGELALGSLGAGVVIAGALSSVADREMFLISADLAWIAKDITPGEGPIEFGLAHSDYTAAEIEEWFEVANGLTTGDKISRERAKRQIRSVGSIDFGLADGQGNARFNDGRIKRTKLGFSIADGQTINIWTRNMNGTDLTTGVELNASGKVYANLL